MSSINDNLTAYYALEEASGQRNDSKGSNHLTDVNTVGSASGKVGTAAHCIQANAEYLFVTDTADLSAGTGDFTICAWVYLDTTFSAGGFVSKDDGSSLEYSLLYHFATNRFRFYISSGPSLANFTTVSANNFGPPSPITWYFLVAWHDSVADTISIQVNDGTPDSAGYTFGSYDSGLSFLLGNELGDLLDGRLDEVAFWKRVLTATERTWLYNSGAGRSYADLLAQGSVGFPFTHLKTGDGMSTAEQRWPS